MDRVQFDVKALEPVFNEIIQLFELGLDKEASAKVIELDKVLTGYTKRLKYVDQCANKIIKDKVDELEDGIDRADKKSKKGGG